MNFLGRQGTREGEVGAALLEMAMAMTIFTVGILAFFTPFAASHSAIQDASVQDEVWFALENAKEELRATPFSDLYTTHHKTKKIVPGKVDAYGNPWAVQFLCHVDETLLPPEFGPVQDIDGGGGLTNNDCSGSYDLLPVQLTLFYSRGQDRRSQSYYVLVGPDD